MKKMLAVCLLVILIPILRATRSVPQAGSLRYVNPTDPTCHRQSPCYSTIQAAVEAALPGETVSVQAGTYNEAVVIKGKNNTDTATEADRIVIEADPTAPPGSVMLGNGSEKCAKGNAIALESSRFVTLRGLTITNASGQSIVLAGGKKTQNVAVHIERNRIFGNGTSKCLGGILVGAGNTNTLIANNLIYGNGQHGLVFTAGVGGLHIVVGNTIHGNGRNGVLIGKDQNVLLVNNIITGNGTDPKTASKNGFGVKRTAPAKNGAPEDAMLLHNLLCGNIGGELKGPLLDPTDEDNLTPTGTEGTGVEPSSGCDVLTTVYENLNGLDGQPNTVDDDFTLAFSSPAIDRGIDPRTLALGVPDALLEADFTHDAIRPQDGSSSGTAEFDIGALEIALGSGGCVLGTSRACYDGPPATASVGVCHAGTQTCGAGGTFGPCTGQVLPGTEICNGADDDCNGQSDDGLGQTTCGVGACQRTINNCSSGQLQTCTPGTPAAQEVCSNQIDDDCNGVVDDPAVCGSGSPLPPDPKTVAPPLDRSVATDLLTSSQFLYTGNNPIQTGVAPDAIDPKRVAVLRGLVMTRDGQPLPGVSVSVHQHPELGQTLSRADGRFDLVVNGGALVLLDYTKAGFLAVQRQVQAPMQDFATLYDVVMIPLDAQVSAIALSSSQPMQVARASRSTDANGTRQATLLFPGGTSATMVFPDGTTQPLSNLSVRATEYTVGPNGPQAMPAELPPTSGYTYAVEFSVDEAKAAGAIDVRFSSPLPLYVENFLNFPVGTGVPLGSYDRKRGVWVAQDNGRVIKILGVSNGQANLDTDGDGAIDNGAALGITDVERQQLATLYTPGQSLWRVLIPHFDQPWDANWGVRPPDTATAPHQDPRIRKDRDDACEAAGSVIECQNQILGEALGVVGTEFTLHYQSERVPGRNIAYKVEIPLSEAQLPGGLLRIELEVSVAGQFHTQTFPAAPNQSTSFTWNGENAYGQVVQGQQPITVRIGYTYPAEYGSTGRFGHDAGDAITGSRTRMEVTLWRTWRDLVGAFDERGIGLGGWTLSPHHTYIPLDKVVYRGDGGRQTARNMPSTISTVAGTGSCGLPIDGGLATATPVCPEGLAVGPDGSLSIASPAVNVVRRVGPDGIITTVAGNGLTCTAADEPCGDGGPARQARISGPFAVAVGADGSLYISEVGQSRPSVRKVAPDGIITTFAGTRTPGFSGDGGLARLAQFSASILSLAAAPDGSLYILDQGNFRIRRVSPDGIVDTVAGTGVGGFSGDGGPAVRAGLADPRGIAVGQDGSLYIADNVRVRRVTPDGVIRTIAGSGQVGFSGDGGPATQASFGALTAVAVAPDDTLYIADSVHFRIRWMRPGGTINTLAGTIEQGTSGDGGPARQAQLQDLNSGLAVGSDGGIYVSQTASNVRVRRISPVLDALLADNGNGYLVPSTDGSEVYVFSLTGQHLRTIDALAGVARYQFAYNGGLLTSITDVNGNVTTIEHDGSGHPTAIVGPFGQRTLLGVNADGYLNRVTSPASEVVQATCTSTGLLTSLTNPRGQTTSYTFDADGFLTSATDPTGATKTFAHSGTNSDYTVTLTTALGRTTTYRVEELDNGDVRLTTTDPSGAQNQALIGGDGIQTATFADGTTVSTVLAPDPRWSMLASIAGSVTVTTPGGRVLTTTAQRTVTLGVRNDLLSLRTQTDTFTINGRNSTTTFDAATRTLTSASAAGRQTSLMVDDRGRPVQEQFGDLEATNFAYDGRGRLATLTQGARATSFAYGSDGFLTSLTDAIGRTVAFTRDADGRVTEQTLPDGRVVRFAYDLNGNVSTLTPPGRPEHTFSYTPRDEVTTYSPPLVGAENDQVQYSYNADRQPLRIDRADGQAVQFQYDTAGRLSLLDLVSGDRSYGYDVASRLTSLQTPLLSMASAYDGGLSTGSTWSGAIAGGVTRTFDNDFRVISDSVNGTSAVAVQYDPDSLRIQVGGLILTRSVQTGLITGASFGSVAETLSYDGFGDLLHYAASQSGSALYALDLNRDALGRITSKSETLGGATHVFSYTYDLGGRLTEVRQDGVLTDSYIYDANGNRLTKITSVGTTSYTYDAQDRLTQDSGLRTQDYSYTPNGERQSKTVAGQTTTYQYDSLGHLNGVSLLGGTQIDYVLDGNGRRVGKKINGALVQGFLYQDGLHPIAELDGAGNVVSRFVYARLANVPAYLIKGGATYGIITDQLGSPRVVIDTATGQIAQQLDYDTFGIVTLDTNPGFQPFGFAGGLYDLQTGLVHFGAREYDPETGRWMAKDPGGFSSGPNLYIYADNDPVNLIDPRGNNPEDTQEVDMREVIQDWEDTQEVDMREIIQDWQNRDPRGEVSSGKVTERTNQVSGEINPPPEPPSEFRLSPGPGRALNGPRCTAGTVGNAALLAFQIFLLTERGQEFNAWVNRPETVRAIVFGPWVPVLYGPLIRNSILQGLAENLQR